MSKLTVTIPDDLHQKIREELERQGITTSQFIEQAITTFFEKPKGVSNMATRTLACGNLCRCHRAVSVDRRGFHGAVCLHCPGR